MRSIGYWRPMTPVEPMRSSSDLMPSFAATWASTARAFASPWAPDATFEFFEMVTTPRALPTATCSRLMRTLQPAKRLWVNMAEHRVPGSPMTTEKSRVVSFTPMFAAYARNPLGQVFNMGAA